MELVLASTSVGRDPELGHGYFTQRLTTAELVLTLIKNSPNYHMWKPWEVLAFSTVALRHIKVTGQAVSSGGERKRKERQQK